MATRSSRLAAGRWPLAAWPLAAGRWPLAAWPPGHLAGLMGGEGCCCLQKVTGATNPPKKRN